MGYTGLMMTSNRWEQSNDEIVTEQSGPPKPPSVVLENGRSHGGGIGDLCRSRGGSITLRFSPFGCKIEP
jgi:hypothetical protein